MFNEGEWIWPFSTLCITFRETSGLCSCIFTADNLLFVCCRRMLAPAQTLLLLALTPAIVRSRTISERVETEYVPPIIYQVGTGNGYHKASDLFRGAINESANGRHLINIGILS